MNIVESYFKSKKNLLKAFGCSDEWRSYLIEDFTNYYWAVAPDKKRILFGKKIFKLGDKSYSAALFASDPFLKKNEWSYSNYKMFIISHQMEKIMAIFDINKEIDLRDEVLI